MGNKNTIFKILAILIVVIALAIITDYVIGLKKLSDLKKSYAELKLQYEDDLEAFKLYKENKELEEKNEKEKEQKIIERKVANSKKGNLDTNSELVQNLYSKILKSNEIAYDWEGSFYKDEKTTIENLTDKEKLIAVIQTLPDKEYTNFKKIDSSISQKLGYRIGDPDDRQLVHVNSLKVYSEQEVIAQAKKIFGDNIDIKITDLRGCAHDYKYIDGNLYSFDFEGGGLGPSNYGYGEIEYVIEDSEYIYIFDKFVYEKYSAHEIKYAPIEASRSFLGGYSITKDFYKHDFTGYYTSSNAEYFIGLEGVNFSLSSEEIINTLYDCLDTYKHTFTKGQNGEYYWVSTEKYKE